MSKLPFELLLALRYLRPKRTFVSIITLISIVGVMLGVAVLIIVISVMSGFGHDLRESVYALFSHVNVQSRRGPMANYALVASAVASNRNVLGVTPYVMAQVILETQPAHGDGLIRAPQVLGVDPHTGPHVHAFITNFVAGTFDLSGRSLVIGKEVASSLELQVGDTVSLWSEQELRRMRAAQKEGREVRVAPTEYTVRGIFERRHHDVEYTLVLTSLENAQEFCGLADSDTVFGLMASVKDSMRVESVARELQRQLGPEDRVATSLEDSPLMAAVIVEKNVMLYILFFIVIVAAFGITCTLITFIVMKTREIGLMKAVGATNRQVMWVFLAQSLIVSVLGVLAGVGLGLLAIAYRNEFLALMRKLTGFQLFPEDIYGMNRLPALVLPGDILIICGGSLVICLLAAAFPAWHASRLNPVEALRHE